MSTGLQPTGGAAALLLRHVDGHPLAHSRDLPAGHRADGELLFDLADLEASHFFERAVEHFPRIRIADDLGVADDECLTDAYSLTGAAVDIDLPVRGLHHRAGPGNLRKLGDEELDGIVACGGDRLADVVVLVAAGF